MNSIKTYFLENSNTIDNIEGAWTVFESFTIDWVTESYIYSTQDNSKTTVNNYTVAIIKEVNGFSEYAIEDGIYQPEKWTIKYSKPYGYTCEYVNDNLKGKSETFNISNNKFEYNLPNINYNFNNVNYKVTIKRTYSKTFPLESDIINKKNDNKKGKEDKNKKSTGTGFAIFSSGFIATCNHVIDDATTIKVKGIGSDFNKSYSAKVVIKDANNNLAII